MHGFAFDTLGYAKRLRDSGVPDAEAEAHAEAAREFIMTELATRHDLEVTRRELEGSVARLELRLEALWQHVDDGNRTLWQHAEDANRALHHHMDDADRRMGDPDRALHQRVDDSTNALQQRMVDSANALHQRMDDSTRTLHQRIDDATNTLHQHGDRSIASLAQRMESTIAAAEQRFAASIAMLRSDMDKLSLRLTVTLGGMIVACTGILAVIVKL